MRAYPDDAVVLQRVELLPNGVSVLIIPCAGYDELKKLPAVLKYRGARFGRTGWNSDSLVAYYRSDAIIALKG